VLHEHAAALSAAGSANRSRGLIKCAKESARYYQEAFDSSIIASFL
jgi:hypothetical protein